MITDLPPLTKQDLDAFTEILIDKHGKPDEKTLITWRAVAEHFLLGYSPIPVPFKQKAPVLKGWQLLVIDGDNIGTHFKNRKNVGLLLGKNGLVEVDLDCKEAVLLGGMILPPTEM